MATPEKDAFELAADYISYKLGSSNEPISDNAALVRKLANEIEGEHETLLAAMCERLDIEEATAAETFKRVADEIFADGINWGRIVVLYTFGGRVATFCNKHHLKQSEEVIGWIGEYVSGMSDWIRKAGGWKNFQEYFEGAEYEARQYFQAYQ